MKKLRGIISGIFRRPIWRTGQGMRGRVHKLSIIAGGEVSIVIRCGLDEPRARQLLQGTLIEFFETREGIPACEDATLEPIVLDAPSRPPQLTIVRTDGCTCGAPGGYPHEPDCASWDVAAGQNAYDRESAQYSDRTIWEHLPPETRQHWIDQAKAKKSAVAQS